MTIIAPGSDYDNMHEVKVDRNLGGIPFKTGKNVTVIIEGYSPDSTPMTHPEMRLYLVGPATKFADFNRTIYRTLTILPVELEPAVIESLKRRDACPLVTLPHPYVAQFPLRSPDIVCREVLFRGSAEEATRLFSCDSHAAVVLGERYLVNHPDDAQKLLVSKIADGMLATGVAKDVEFRTQKRLIDALDEVGTQSPSSAIPDLFERLLATIEKETPSVPMPKRDESKLLIWGMNTSWRMAEEQTTDVNHTLAWLAMKMDEDEVARRWGQRLQTVRDHLTGWWRHELDLAIDVARIDQNEELDTMLARMDGAKPVRFNPVFEHVPYGVGKVVLSSDGKYLATDCNGVSIRRTTDWKQVAALTPASISVAFSPDGNFLYVADPWLGSIFQPAAPRLHPAVSRIDWRTGRVDKDYRCESVGMGSIHLSRDGGVMTTIGDNRLAVWDTADAKIIRSVKLSQLYPLALSADGARVARTAPYKKDDSRGPASCSIVIESSDGGEMYNKLHCDFDAQELEFTSDAHYLACAGSPDYNAIRLDIYNIAGNGEKTATVTMAGHAPQALTISPGGKFIALADWEGRFWVYALPGLKPLWSTRFAENCKVCGIAFTPDEKMLVLANSQPTPRFIRMDTFDEVIPYPGHPFTIERMFFSADGKQITSFDWGSTICRWNADTLEMIGRTKSPLDSRLASIEPQGKYALYLDQKSENGTTPSDLVFNKIRIVDPASGRTVSTMDVPPDSGWDSVAWLSGGEALLFSRSASYVTRIDYLKGHVLNRAPIARYNEETAFLSNDRLNLLWLKPDSKDLATCLDLATGKSAEVSVTNKEGDKIMANGREYQLLEIDSNRSKSPAFSNLPELYGVANDDDRTVFPSPDGRRLARVVKDGNYFNLHHPKARPLLVVIYDAATMKALCAVHPTNGCVTASLNPDATRLAIAGEDGSLEVWPLPR